MKFNKIILSVLTMIALCAGLVSVNAQAVTDYIHGSYFNTFMSISYNDAVLQPMSIWNVTSEYLSFNRYEDEDYDGLYDSSIPIESFGINEEYAGLFYFYQNNDSDMEVKCNGLENSEFRYINNNYNDGGLYFESNSCNWEIRNYHFELSNSDDIFSISTGDFTIEGKYDDTTPVNIEFNTPIAYNPVNHLNFSQTCSEMVGKLSCWTYNGAIQNFELGYCADFNIVTGECDDCRLKQDCVWEETVPV